jgi:SAM-dependent methyltransferase
MPIGRCPDCGIGRSDVTDFEPGAYYTESYFDGGHADGYADYEGSAEILRGEFRRTVGHLVELGVTGGRLLEVGCAYGFFLDEARARFEVSGIEISEAAAAAARGRHPDVRTGPLDASTLAGLSDLDAIVLLDVIEHLEDPAGAIALCSERLRRGGVLLVTTGDWGSVVARTLGPRWRLMTPPQHLWFFTRGSLSRIAAGHGLSEASFCHPWKHVPLPLIAFQLQRMVFGRAAKGSWVPNVGIPVNLFDAMRMVFRRS